MLVNLLSAMRRAFIFIRKSISYHDRGCKIFYVNGQDKQTEMMKVEGEEDDQEHNNPARTAG